MRVTRMAISCGLFNEVGFCWVPQAELLPVSDSSVLERWVRGWDSNRRTEVLQTCCQISDQVVNLMITENETEEAIARLRHQPNFM
jgi:hypothetical protein